LCFKDLIYLPLEADSAEEARDAMECLPLLGVSVTMPLKETLPTLLNLPSPQNTIWHRAGGESWQSANTDAEALDSILRSLAFGPVLILGSGGTAKTSAMVVKKIGRAIRLHSRRSPLSARDISIFAPVGIIHATCLGMNAGDSLPFPDILGASLPTLRWAVDWVNRKETAFSSWAISGGLQLISGAELFERQAILQSRIFIRECGGQIE
jgi:shikimate 5-dehydrogenase